MHLLIWLLSYHLTLKGAATTNPPKHYEIQTGKASYYSEEGCIGCRHDRITACGDRFDETAFTIASNTIPCNTEVVARYDSRTVRARVSDTGGFGKRGRIADFSKAAFKALAPLSRGVIDVQITYEKP